jgi:CheY-like chemotaxis protein
MPRVLIVDDDPSYLMIMDRLCRGCGAEVVTVDTAEAARAALAEHEFNLMLFDLQLPRQEGLPLIAEVEQDPRLAPRAVVVTGFPTLAPAFTQLPVIDKSHLEQLAGFLRKMLAFEP